MNSHTITREALDTFKASWPCHGLPDSLHTIRFDFAANGDLVDIIAKARNGRTMDSAAFDGPGRRAGRATAGTRVRAVQILTPSLPENHA